MNPEKLSFYDNVSLFFGNVYKKIAHKHQYVKIGFKQAEDQFSRYSIRKYQCQTCQKIKWVDGRMDYLE